VVFIGCLPVPPRGLAKVLLLHSLTLGLHVAEIVLGVGMPLIGCLPSQANHLVHLTLQFLGQRAPRRPPPIHPPLHIQKSSRPLLKQLFGSWWELHAAHGAHLLEAERPQPRDDRRVKGVLARKGVQGARDERDERAAERAAGPAV
jgi:hypothetical protein